MNQMEKHYSEDQEFRDWISAHGEDFDVLPLASICDFRLRYETELHEQEYRDRSKAIEDGTKRLMQYSPTIQMDEKATHKNAASAHDFLASISRETYERLRSYSAIQKTKSLRWAIKKFHKALRSIGAVEVQPANTSESKRGVWHLHNCNGRLARVYPDGSVKLG